MQDIRLVDSDGEYLNLETQSGEKFRLVLDDSLRSAIKREATVQLDSVSISPREIQDLVRSGISANDVATKHGVAIEYVEKFALTVVDEMSHIIASAKTVRISVEADRYSEATQMEFGEILEGRLKKAGASNVEWSATKLEGEPWMVSVSYDANKEHKAAIWSFDQRKLVLSPENDAAVRFSAGDFTSNIVAPKLREVDSAEDSTKVIELPRVDFETVDDNPSAERPTSDASVSSIEQLTRSSLQAVSEESGLEPISTFELAESPEVDETAESLSPTADLLEALRKKRSASKTSHEQEKQETPEVVAADEPAEVEEITPEAVQPSTKKGRPSMPSWDEIVFGTKTDD